MAKPVPTKAFLQSAKAARGANFYLTHPFLDLVSRSQTLTQKAGESLVTLAYELC